MSENHCNQTFTTKKRQQFQQLPEDDCHPENDRHGSVQSEFEEFASVESVIEYSDEEEEQEQQEIGDDEGNDVQQQQQLAEEQEKLAKDAEKLNNWSFNTTDHQVDAIVERMRMEFCTEMDEVRKMMNAKIQELQKENVALKNQFEAQIAFVKMDLKDNKENEEARISAALQLEIELAKLRANNGKGHQPQLVGDQREKLQKVAHFLDQVDAKMSLVDLSKNYWNTRDYQGPSVQGRTVTSCYAGYDAIRTMFGYSTSMLAVPASQHTFKVCYAEFTILAMIDKFIFIALAPANFPVRKIPGSLANTYSINKKGTLRCAGVVTAGFVPNGFAQGDTIGCGLVMINCAHCDPCRLFFTKNGQILGTPLPISPTCSELFPTISFHGAGSKVIGNFGNEPFKYAIPPAKGLCVGGFCCCCKKN